MFNCYFCGLENPSQTAKICSNCGPSKKWFEEEVDQPKALKTYQALLSELVFDNHTLEEIKVFSDRARDRFKISISAHSEILSKLKMQKSEVAALMQFQLEFDENVLDAYAGHDTYLKFRLTNTSADEMFKAELKWDDPETPDEMDLIISVKSYVKSGQDRVVGGTHVFSRGGFKEIEDLHITISNQLLDSATFRVEPFNLKVGNPDQNITQNISTHNQISIEGRGVVDASGMGTERNTDASNVSLPPIWKKLSLSYVPSIEKLEETVRINGKIVEATQQIQQKHEESKTIQESRIALKGNDLPSAPEAMPRMLDAVEHNNNHDEYVDIKNIILDCATKKLGVLSKKFIINSNEKFYKKIDAFKIPKETYIHKFDKSSRLTADPLLFFDATMFGNGKTGIVFTDEYIVARGCVCRIPSHRPLYSPPDLMTIKYSEMQNIRLPEGKDFDKQIYIESAEHKDLVVLQLHNSEDGVVEFVIEMLNKIVNFSKF